jgi:tetratricopeptide (TPR) repeat protein
LATALDASGVEVTPEALQPMLFIPGRGGSLQPEILSTARRFDRIPYVIEPTFEALVREIDAGRPVIVLQNLGVSIAPQWHYAVVVGYSGPQKEFILRSGTTKRLLQSSRTFASTWARGDHWGVVLLPPGELPADANASRYLQAVASAESAGQFELAIAAYRTAALYWPGHPLAMLGLANSYHATGQLDRAEYWYRALLEIDPGNVIGMNNLATMLGERGECIEARELLERALNEAAGDSAYRSILERTQAGLGPCH